MFVALMARYHSLVKIKRFDGTFNEAKINGNKQEDHNTINTIGRYRILFLQYRLTTSYD